ncbi:NUDIX hydrolase [Nocardia uniformis]|uniref:NUDIX hydrolase n=1 Tax=Nocardia uniformis TaxID=53432 RepID=A0A849CDI3_9NOCA|nr:NUDIX hydrolase [Nocardia uniformis]NNH76046.1 NUDIX hydrolase [Nocardia uniformis]
MSTPDVRRAQSLLLRRVAAPSYTTAELGEIARCWSERQQGNPHLFNGPIVVARDVSWTAEHQCRIDWSTGTYAQYLWRHAADVSRRRRPYARVVFASMLARTGEGDLVLGRMAGHTATPGRIQLPGGNVEPPGHERDLTAATVRGHALRELHEETGLTPQYHPPRLWGVTVGSAGDVGVLFEVRVAGRATVGDTFTRHCMAAETTRETPEFDSLITVAAAGDGRVDDREGLSEAYGVDYLPEVLRTEHGAGSIVTSEWCWKDSVDV